MPRIRPATAIVPLLLLAAACGKGGEGAHGADAKGAAAPPLAVATIRVAQRKVPVSLEAVGQAEGSREVEIRARVSGILEKRMYNEGEAVAAGQPLFLIDPATYALAVEQARAALVQERVRRELAQTDAQRLQPLADEKAISRRELDQALATEKTAVASIASAEAKLKQAELDLSYTRVVAPISGVTGRALHSEGSLVTANTESSLLTTLTQVNPIWVRFPLAESDYGRIRGAERQAKVQIVGDDGAVLADNGRLNFAGTTVDAKTGAVQLRAEFPNPGVRWFPGQFAKIRVLAGEQNAMLVPQSAMLQNDQSRIVMTVGPDGKVVPKPVQTANWIGQDAVVIGGLAEGDTVIVDNLIKVRPGAVVQPKGPAQASAK
jgi:membrane fusion protein (multidrug efflux system)